MSFDPAAFASSPAPGRSCGTCTLCCKVFDVPSLEKPAGKWCQHCRPGRGCGIHETRPQHCRSFHCLWMTASWLGPEWKPEKAKFVLTVDPARNLLVQLDPGSPAAWRSEPYLGQIRRWAAAALEQGNGVFVFNNHSATAVYPDREVVLGEIGPDECIVPEKIVGMSGVRIEFRKAERPRPAEPSPAVAGA